MGTYGNAVSIKEIAESIKKGLEKKKINVRFPEFVFNLLCKVKPDIMVRLYGTLAFTQEDNYIKINYEQRSSMKSEIGKMIMECKNAR